MKLEPQDIAKIREIKAAYQNIYVAALEDMQEFCCANKTCVVPGDHDRTLIREGRREVWLRMMAYRKLDMDELVKRIEAGE